MPSSASSGIASSASRATFWPRDREQVAEPGAAEILDRRRVDPLVLAEHEAARQLRLARRHPPAERRPRPARGSRRCGRARAHHRDDPDQDRQRGAARITAAHGCRRARSDSIVAGPIPRHLVELVDRGEPAVLVAELDDVPAVTGPMPSIVFELLDRGAAEADRALFAGRPPRRRRPDRARDEDLLTVGEPGGQVDPFQHRLARGAAGPRDRIGDPAPAGSR